MIDINKTYETACGFKVVLYTTEAPRTYCVVGEMHTNDTPEPVKIMSWLDTGEHHNIPDFNLVEVKPVMVYERWFNIYDDGETWACLTPSESRKGKTIIARLHIRREYKEGDGL